MGLATLTDEQKDNIAIEQLARLIFADMKQKAKPPYFNVNNDPLAPFTGYKVSDKPADASQMCILVANPDHSIIPDTGNCMVLPLP